MTDEEKPERPTDQEIKDQQDAEKAAQNEEHLLRTAGEWKDS